MEKKILEKAIHGLCCAGLTIAVAACQTIDPYTGESKTSNATKGAGIGAAAGNPAWGAPLPEAWPFGPFFFFLPLPRFCCCC